MDLSYVPYIPTDVAKVIYRDYIAARSLMVMTAVEDVLGTIMRSILIGEVKLREYDAEGVNIKVISFGNSEKRYDKDIYCYWDERIVMYRSTVLSINGQVFLLYCAVVLEADPADDHWVYNVYFNIWGDDVEEYRVHSIVASMIRELLYIEQHTYDHDHGIGEYYKFEHNKYESYKPQWREHGLTIFHNRIHPDLYEMLLNKTKKVCKRKGFPRKYKHLQDVYKYSFQLQYFKNHFELTMEYDTESDDPAPVTPVADF